jgi:uncharacterized heparinase superfamily protein
MQTHRPRFELAATPLRAAREHLRLAALAVDRARHGTISRVRRSRLLGWRHRVPVAQELVLAPPDLRPVDESFAFELARGSIGLAGVTATRLADASAFTLPPPTLSWARELHGFGWLRHLAADADPESAAQARDLIGKWLSCPPRKSHCAWDPDVAGRRMISWLSHATLWLDGADQRAADALMIALEDHASYLSASWSGAAPGYPRLLALIGLVQASLCIAGHERLLASAERHLVDELGRQVLEDGSHATRNPAVLVELLLDLLPLRQCLVAGGFEPPAMLPTAIGRMMQMLRRLRLGDGQLARFNGVGATEGDALATVLSYDSNSADGPTLPCVSESGYVRLQRSETTIVVDAGGPPSQEIATRATASCLAFEVSVRGEPLFVNGGLPGPAHAQAVAAARATAAHNTLELGGQSSARLVRNERMERRLGGLPIRGPEHVTCEVHDLPSGGIALEASHDGYADRFKLVHTRTLSLDASGTRLDGIDVLDGSGGDMRFAWDVPFAVHFHLHPSAGARLLGDGSVVLLLPSGERWHFAASGAAPAIEESTHYAHVRGPVRTQQIVLRAVCCGMSEVRWTLERQPPSASANENAVSVRAAAS